MFVFIEISLTDVPKYCIIYLVAAQRGPVVQLVRTLACHARGRGFESLLDRHLFLLPMQ